MTRFLLPALIAGLLAAGCGSGGTTSTTTPELETTRAHQSGAEGPTGITARVCRHTREKALLLRVTGVSCAKGETVAAAWGSKANCAPAPGDSRSACTISGFRCLTAVAGRGLVVTCARPERSIAFIVERG